LSSNAKYRPSPLLKNGEGHSFAVKFRAGVRKEVETGLIDFDKSLRHALSHLCVIMYSRNMDFPLDAWFQHNGNMIVIGIH